MFHSSPAIPYSLRSYAGIGRISRGEWQRPEVNEGRCARAVGRWLAPTTEENVLELL